jgi:hypothetical protein
MSETKELLFLTYIKYAKHDKELNHIVCLECMKPIEIDEVNKHKEHWVIDIKRNYVYPEMLNEDKLKDMIIMALVLMNLFKSLKND